MYIKVDMRKKKFYSNLFNKYIEPNDPFFKQMVIAELLFRINQLEESKCDCMNCNAELKKYKEFLESMRGKK
jgi:hypothetical protein